MLIFTGGVNGEPFAIDPEDVSTVEVVREDDEKKTILATKNGRGLLVEESFDVALRAVMDHKSGVRTFPMAADYESH